MARRTDFDGLIEVEQDELSAITARKVKHICLLNRQAIAAIQALT
jgi:hypothetical protein